MRFEQYPGTVLRYYSLVTTDRVDVLILQQYGGCVYLAVLFMSFYLWYVCHRRC